MSKKRRWIKKRNRALRLAGKREQQRCQYVQAQTDIIANLARLADLTEMGVVPGPLTERIFTRLLEFMRHYERQVG